MPEIELSEEQKKIVESASLISTKRLSIKKVRIPTRFEEISVEWLRYCPFFSEFMLRFHYYQTEDIPTMGVNSMKGRINLYFNPKFVDGGNEVMKIGPDGFPIVKKGKDGKPLFDADNNPICETEIWPGLNDKELRGVLAHEIMHLVKLHTIRALEDHDLWNIAGDMLINDELKDFVIDKQKLELPKGALYLDMARKEGYKGDPITEALYYWLDEKKQKFMNQFKDMMQSMGGQSSEQQKCQACGGDGKEKDSNGNETGNPCPHCGGTGKEPGQNNSDKGKGGKLFDTLFGSKIDDHSILEASDELSESTIKEVVDSARVRGWGKLSGNGVSYLENLFAASKISWRTLLRKFLTNAIMDHGPIYESSWARRNRRGFPLPGTKKLSNKLIIAIDTSGSIDIDLFGRFFTEVEKIVKDFNQLSVIQCDADIQDVWPKYKKGDYKKIELKGRGGTAVQPVFDWIQENHFTKYPLIYFTDGYFDNNFDTHGVNVVWAVCGSENEPPHGQTIFIEEK